MKPPIEPLLTCSDIGVWLNCSVATVSRLCKTNGIPHIRLGGGIRFSREQVEEWISRGGKREVGHNSARPRGRPRMVGAVATQTDTQAQVIELKN